MCDVSFTTFRDLRGNELKDVERGLFSEMGAIRRL